MTPANQTEPAFLYALIIFEIVRDGLGLKYSDSLLKTLLDDDDNLPSPFDDDNVLFDWKYFIPQPLLQSSIMAKNVVHLVPQPASVVYLYLVCNASEAK